MPSSNYVKIEDFTAIKKFLLESFIYENNFNLHYKNYHYAGILLKLEYNGEKALVIRFPNILPEQYKEGNEYELQFNNSRGKFYTTIKIEEIFVKGKRSYIITNFPIYLYRLQRRSSIRAIPDYLNKPIMVKFFLEENTSDLKIRDIGLQGFSITLSQDTRIAGQKRGDILKINLKFPDSNYSYKTKAKLIHGSTILNKYRAGFQLLDIDENLKNEIINYLVIRRLEIKNKILKKEKGKDIYDHLGEWLENFLKYEKDKFKDFPIAIITNENKKFEFINSYFPSIKFFTSDTLNELEKFNPYFIIFHINKTTKSKWYKFVKLKKFQYIPTIVVSKDANIFHLLKEKSFYSVIVKEEEIESKLIDTVSKYSNVLIPHVFLDSLRKKPLYDGEEKKVAIIDDSIFGYSANQILKGVNFITRFYKNLDEFLNKGDNIDVLLFDPTFYDIKDAIDKILSLNKKYSNIILTFQQIEPYFSKFSFLFSDFNLLIKPYKYDNLISKVMAFKDNIEEIPLINQIPLYFISSEESFSNFFKDLLDELFQKDSFKLIDITENLSFEERETKIFMNLNAKYDINYLNQIIKKHEKQKNEIIGVIYKPIHKKLIMNYIKYGIKRILLANEKDKFFEKFKEYYFLR